MSLADLSVKRPVFITCIIIIMIALGLNSLSRLGVDLFPNVTFPVVTVTTVYPGAGPAEIETLVSKPLEDELSTLSGIKRLSSINEENVSTVVAEFALETDIKFAENQIRDRVGSTKRKMPNDIQEPVIRRIDPADQPVVILSVDAEGLSPGQLYDLASERIRVRLEQVPQVGLVDVVGGRKREIQVLLDRNQLKAREISASQVAQRLGVVGENVPAGKVNEGKREIVFRALGQFRTLEDIRNAIVNFFGSDVATRVKDVGTVKDTLVDEKTRALVNGKPSLFLYVFRQSGANTIAVVENLKKRIGEMNTQFEKEPGKPTIRVIRDGSVWIKNNVDDVKESIIIGVVLAVVVVYFFLANGRSTIITGLALPNSLIGAFILMSMAGFTVNIMTLLALSLSVGLLVDDAIVVRENIFRHMEMGKSPIRAALEGTGEVRLAVIATTLAVLAVFGPVGFLKGVVGQFFKEFGLTICFAMLISLFDALTIAPMLSAYFGGHHKGEKEGFIGSLWSGSVGRLVAAFNRLNDRMENAYANLVGWIVRHTALTLVGSVIVSIGSCSVVKFVPKTFLPAQDAGEFLVAYDLPPGTSLDETQKLADKIDGVIRGNPEVELAALTVGGSFSGRETGSNLSEIYVKLVSSKKRKVSTIEFKDRLRDQLKEFAFASPKVKDYDAVGGGMRPVALNLLGEDQKQLEEIATELLVFAKANRNMKDPDLNFRAGKPEFQVALDLARADQLGIASGQVGAELRTHVEGVTPAKFREGGLEYDVRVRMKEDQRNIRSSFENIYVPNINFNLVSLSQIAKPKEATGPSRITRQNRARYVQLGADVAPNGGGMGQIIQDVTEYFTKTKPLPSGVRFEFVGQAENFKELGESMATAMAFGVLFIFLVLASLYESFVTPFTIMLALPLAVSGSMVALFLGNKTLDIFSMIGVIMLLGVSAKNSILLVDYANQLIAKGKSRSDALIEAGRTRLRPILMTTMALVAGTIPIAIGLNEASRQRTSMGVAIIGGLISSTLLTLLVVPAAFSAIDRFRIWSRAFMAKLFGVNLQAELEEESRIESRTPEAHA